MRVAQAEGVRGLWKGSFVLLARGATLTSSQLMGYSSTKALCIRNGMQDGPVLQSLSSLVGALTLTTFVMPLDVTLNRYHASASLGGHRFSGPLQCFLAIQRTEGVAALWRGWTAMFVRCPPSHP